ncbi:MAG: virulence-associated protein E, partial [Rhodospirillaceae bacterium]|nr:virulence-associated protein E [Rhodospirillaceae bacterium]
MNAREITKALGGDWFGGYGLVPGIGHSARDRSIKVMDAADGEIIVHSFTGDDWRDIKAEWVRQGLLPEWQRPEHRDPQEAEQHRQEARERQQQRDEEQRADDARKTQVARDIFQGGVSAKESPVSTYLQARGIKLDAPPSLRYASDLKHGPTGQVLPAMVAAVQDISGHITGIHRTFLTSDGRKKAPVTDNKMMFGPCAGGAVRLALAKDSLCVGEGIETMLSIQQETGRPCWAALSTSGLIALVL